MLLPVIAHEKGYIFDTHNSTYQAMKSGQLIDIFKGNIFGIILNNLENCLATFIVQFANLLLLLSNQL